MASEWFYTLKGEKHGPVSSQELRRLAQAGTLSSTDLLWKEGMKDWRPASEAQKLFDGVSSSDSGSTKTEVTETASAPTSVEAPNSSKVAVSLGARMQNAARATALKAEQTKLTNVSLPAAYIALGKHLHSKRLLMEQFPDLYQQIDALQAKAADASRKAAEATGTNFTEKAKALAQKGAELAKSKAAEVQQLAVFKRLGEAAYEGSTADSIEAERLVDIVTIRKRVAAITETLMVDADAGPGSLEPAPSVKSDGGAKWPWKRRIKWVGGSLAALYLVGLVFGSRKEDAHQSNAALQGRQTASSVTRSETTDATLGANAATGGQGDSTSSENQVNQYLRDMRDGYADQQRANEAQAQQMREETSRKMQEEERVAREQQAKWRKKHEEEQAARERQQREEQANLDAMRKQPAAMPPVAVGNEGKTSAVAASQTATDQKYGDEEVTARENSPFPVTRGWFESDEKYLRRGVDLVATKCRGAKVTKLTLQPASEPWKGFRGEVYFDNQTRANIEAHTVGNGFIVVLYAASRWLGYGADFLDASANTLTSDEFCKKAYGKTPEQMLEVFQEEESRRVTAVALWNMASNEAQMQKRFSEPFQVTGEVFEVEKTYSGWHVKLVGHRVGRLADGWIDCLMKEKTGLDKVMGGSMVTVEGRYKSGTTVVELQECRIVK
jgi:hypothetical protein